MEDKQKAEYEEWWWDFLRGTLPLPRVELPLRTLLVAAAAFSVSGKVHELAPVEGKGEKKRGLVCSREKWD